MNDELFIENWGKLDVFTRKAFKDFARNPTERNSCHMVGYIAALADRGLIPEVGYWLALAGQIREADRARDAVRFAAID